MILGEIIKDLRESQNYSQRELSKMLNISPACLSKYETGRSMPSPEMLIKIADTFNVSVDYLLGRNSLQFDYSILDEKFYKVKTNFDIINDIIALDSTHRKLVSELLEMIGYHNKHQGANKKTRY